MDEQPSLPASNGRTSKGTFAPGNKLGKGNPWGRHANQLRSLLFGAVTPEDFLEIVQMLIKKAKEGDLPSIKEFLDRLIGKAPSSLDVPEEGEEQSEEDNFSFEDLSQETQLQIFREIKAKRAAS